MSHIETIEEFYVRKKLPHVDIFTRDHGHFNVYNREFCQGVTPYRRRDFYKISLIIGTGTIHYADKSIEIDRPALVFSNPMIPYSWEINSEHQSGYFCLFTETFIRTQGNHHALHESPLYGPGGHPVFFIHEDQLKFIRDIFVKMEQEMASDYVHKYSLLYNYVNILIHEAMKIQPADNYFKQGNASARIADLFIELLERQFPIDSPDHVLELKRAADYAAQLSVHVNHLNRAVKANTGKTTSTHIAERIVAEARALLVHTDWNISEIAYALGFEYPSYFNNFFRKQTNLTPGALRNGELQMYKS